MKTILLVDDSATILLSISNILTKAGYAVDKAGNAAEGLKKFSGPTKIDLLITDLNMPGMNGIEFIKEVRKLPAYKFMPILFLTTESQQDKRMEAKAAGHGLRPHQHHQAGAALILPLMAYGDCPHHPCHGFFIPPHERQVPHVPRLAQEIHQGGTHDHPA